MSKGFRLFSTIALPLFAVLGKAQGFNIDFYGGAAPSPSFGAAADQLGYWNHGGQLLDLNGNRSGVRLELTGDVGAGSNYNPNNTGDYERLLNDALFVGTVNGGGRMQIAIHGLEAGAYRVFTYAVLPFGDVSNAPIYVPQAQEDSLQRVTGPMPGNSFEFLITHSVHEVALSAGGQLQIIVEREPFSPTIAVNGLQIVPLMPGHRPVATGSSKSDLAWLLSPRP